jgi:hypothetical protein
VEGQGRVVGYVEDPASEVPDMLAFYRLRCDRSFLIWPRSLTAVHDSSNAPVEYGRSSAGNFSTAPFPATPDADGLARGERAVARVA